MSNGLKIHANKTFRNAAKNYIMGMKVSIMCFAEDIHPNQLQLTCQQ